MISSFQRIEQRVKQECEKYADQEAHNLMLQVAKKLGYGHMAYYNYPAAFTKAWEALEQHATDRLYNLKLAEVWDKAEAAALDSIKSCINK